MDYFQFSPKIKEPKTYLTHEKKTADKILYND